MQVFLELSGHPKANVRQVVLSRTTTIGRSKECGLQIASGSVSRKHCELRIEGDVVSVVDLGSSNGTFVDTDRLPAGEARILTSDSRLNVGGVRFTITFAAPVASPATESEDVQFLPAPAAPAAAAILEDEPILEVDDADSIFADEPLLVPDDEPVLAEETAPAAEPALPEPVAAEMEESISLDDEPDLAALFADEPVSSEARSPQEVADEPVSEDDEPILVSDEDEAFAFLTDDASSGGESPPEDSTLGVR